MEQLRQFITIILSLCLCLYSYITMAKPSTDCLYSVTNVRSNDSLSIRVGPGVKYKKIGNIPSNGNNIKIVGDEIQIGRFFWVPIEYNAINGWVNTWYLKKDCHASRITGEANAICSFKVVNVDFNDTLSVRNGPGTHYQKIYRLAPNAIGITRTGRRERVGRSYWTPISYNDIQGWVNSSYLKEDCSKPNFAKTPNVSCSFKVINVDFNDTLSVRNGAGTHYDKIYGLSSKATDIEIIGRTKRVGNSYWLAIRYNDIKGWVNSGYLKRDCGEANVSHEANVNCSFDVVNVLLNDTLSIRKGPGIQYKQIYQLSSTATGIEITGRTKKVGKSYWIPIRYNYIQGWVNRGYIEEVCF